MYIYIYIVNIYIDTYLVSKLNHQIRFFYLYLGRPGNQILKKSIQKVCNNNFLRGGADLGYPEI